MITQEELELRLQDFLQQHQLHAVEGQHFITDWFMTPYTTLINGLPKKEGAVHTGCVFLEADEPIWRHFKAELLNWLAGRDLIAWRSPPKLESYEVAEITGDVANREAVLDGMETPRLAHYTKTYWVIRCRLTAYKA